jgi:hypothetical protein
VSRRLVVEKYVVQACVVECFSDPLDEVPTMRKADCLLYCHAERLLDAISIVARRMNSLLVRIYRPPSLRGSDQSR